MAKAKIWIKKIEELPGATHPNNISVGWEFLFNQLPDSQFQPPTVGRRFRAGYLWSTSIVTEIIDESKFKTLNSVYEWEIIEEFEKGLVVFSPKELEILLKTII